MGRTQLMRVRVRAPDPEYPDDGYEVIETAYADGHTEEPRRCTCGADHEPEGHERLCPGCRSLDGEHTFGVTCTLPREHATDCPESEPKLTDLEWLREELNHCCPEDYLWGGGEPPCKEPEFNVFGCVWAEHDYWGEWDGGFEFERAEP